MYSQLGAGNRGFCFDLLAQSIKVRDTGALKTAAKNQVSFPVKARNIIGTQNRNLQRRHSIAPCRQKNVLIGKIEIKSRSRQRIDNPKMQDRLGFNP